MVTIELPLPQTFDLTTWLYAAYPRCVLEASGFAEWTAARYLRMFAWEGSLGDDPDSRFALVLDYVDSFAYRSEGILEEVLVDYREAHAIDSFPKALEAWLADGYYATVFLDVARLADPNSVDCILHEILIYGIDRKSSTVSALAFDTSQGLPIFGRVTLSFADLSAAFDSGIRYVLNKDEPWPIYLCQLLRPNRASSAYSAQFDPEAAAKQIGLHFDSVPADLAHHYYWWDKSKLPPGVAFFHGAEIVQPAAHHLEHVAKQRRSLDFRAVHVIDEHHSMLVRALGRIASQRRSQLSVDTQANLRAVGDQLSRIRMKCLSASVRHKPVPVALSADVVAAGKWQEDAVRSALADLSR